MQSDGSEREVSDGTLTFRIRRDGEGSRLSLAGELDLANAETFTTELEKVEADDGSPITIDLTELEFIDSTGIAALLGAHRRINESGDGTRLRFVASRAPAVSRVISLTGLDETMPFVPASD